MASGRWSPEGQVLSSWRKVHPDLVVGERWTAAGVCVPTRLTAEVDRRVYGGIDEDYTVLECGSRETMNSLIIIIIKSV